MTGSLASPDVGEVPGARRGVFVISVVAELTSLHPQTLRTYERLGLLAPARTPAGARRYSQHDLDVIGDITRLTAAGVNIEGVRQILALRAENARLTEQLHRHEQNRSTGRHDRADSDATSVHPTASTDAPKSGPQHPTTSEEDSQ